MKLIEADKVEQAIKDYWKAQVDRLPRPKSIEEHDAYVNRLDTCLEHNSELLKEIEALPPAEPDATTHDSIPAETGKNDGDGTSGDCISRQQAFDAMDSEIVRTNPEHFKSIEKFIKFMDDADIANFGKWQWANGFNIGVEAARIQLKKLPSALPSAQPFHNITMNDVLEYIDCMPEDVWQEFTACLECRGWELQRRTAKWCGGDFA